MIKKPVIIAIDGPAASGKGSLARRLAAHFGYDFLDTGALYRRVALAALQRGIQCDDCPALHALLPDLIPALSDAYNDDALRTDAVGTAASRIAQNQMVRDFLFDYQRNFALQAAKGAVLDGRDIGTVICPDADVKLFVTATLEERAKRRQKELQSKGFAVTYASVLAEMQERDERDSSRLQDHLKPDHDGVVIDTSDMIPDEVFKTALDIIRSRT